MNTMASYTISAFTTVILVVTDEQLVDQAVTRKDYKGPFALKHEASREYISSDDELL